MQRAAGQVLNPSGLLAEPASHANTTAPLLHREPPAERVVGAGVAHLDVADGRAVVLEGDLEVGG